jgi:starch phosphorylase
MAAGDHVQGGSALAEIPRSLLDIALNLRWSWDRRSRELLRRLDPEGWEAAGHNPVLLLKQLPPERLDAALADPAFASDLAAASTALREYLDHPRWFDREHPGWTGGPIAYFSAEFGITECLPFYAGGLGTLAGDHLKSASDLGLPFVGVGLTYRSGYFRQVLDQGGWQAEIYEDHDFGDLPLTRERGANGEPVEISVPFPSRPVRVTVWRASVGRVPLFLLDTNLPDNAPEDRDICRHLYGGDVETRLRQELILGIGGVRVLAAMGIRPAVTHINEGHSAFLLLERIHQGMRDRGKSFEEARAAAAAASLFTTHTPVPAGFDLFGPDLFARYLGPFAAEIGVPVETLFQLGVEIRDGGYPVLNMALLALRNSAHRNAVSLLHGKVSRSMWHAEWPGLPDEKVPVGSVTNGVHRKTWVSDEMDALYERHLDRDWGDAVGPAIWTRVDTIPPRELWEARLAAKARFLEFLRPRLRAQNERHTGPDVPDPAEAGFSAEALTLGFARRFAPYKRATLLLRDPGRLKRLLTDPERPVQLVFAGKSHPANQAGKELLAAIVRFAREPEVAGKIAFLEDYDVEVARHLVQGVDVWLNTPRRPQEASGTSGMKAVVNGVLNLSILDGWWDEAYAPERGWAIGGRETVPDEWAQDQADAESLYATLEEQVVPAYYRRGEDGLPAEWVWRMKASIRELAPAFGTHRMVREYLETYYLPAARGGTPALE